MSSKLLHFNCDGVEDFLLITPDMSDSDIKEKLFEMKGYSDPRAIGDLNLVIMHNNYNVKIEDMEDNSPSDPYVIKVLGAAEFAKFKKVP